MKSVKAIAGFEPASFSRPVQTQKFPLVHLAHEREWM